MYYRITVKGLVKMRSRKKGWKNEIKERFQSLKYEIIFLTLQTMKNELLLNGTFQRYEINM